MSNGPGYTVKDLVFYTGLFGGIIAMYFILQPHEVHQIVVLISGIVLGSILGYLMLKVYENATGTGEDDSRNKFD